MELPLCPKQCPLPLPFASQCPRGKNMMDTDYCPGTNPPNEGASPRKNGYGRSRGGKGAEGGDDNFLGSILSLVGLGGVAGGVCCTRQKDGDGGLCSGSMAHPFSERVGPAKRQAPAPLKFVSPSTSPFSSGISSPPPSNYSATAAAVAAAVVENIPEEKAPAFVHGSSKRSPASSPSPRPSPQSMRPSTQSINGNNNNNNNNNNTRGGSAVGGGGPSLGRPPATYGQQMGNGATRAAPTPGTAYRPAGYQTVSPVRMYGASATTSTAAIPPNRSSNSSHRSNSSSSSFPTTTTTTTPTSLSLQVPADVPEEVPSPVGSINSTNSTNSSVRSKPGLLAMPRTGSGSSFPVVPPTVPRVSDTGGQMGGLADQGQRSQLERMASGAASKSWTSGSGPRPIVGNQNSSSGTDTWCNSPGNVSLKSSTGNMTGDGGLVRRLQSSPPERRVRDATAIHQAVEAAIYESGGGGGGGGGVGEEGRVQAAVKAWPKEMFL